MGRSPRDSFKEWHLLSTNGLSPFSVQTLIVSVGTPLLKPPSASFPSQPLCRLGWNMC